MEINVEVLNYCNDCRLDYWTTGKGHLSGFGVSHSLDGNYNPGLIIVAFFTTAPG
jgi:hypothetical protein